MSIDILTSWASNKGVTLFASPDNDKIASYYISKGQETLQVVLEDRGSLFRIDIWSVETAFDEEVHFHLDIATQDLPSRLDQLNEKIQSWFETRHI